MRSTSCSILATPAELREAAAARSFQLGPDGTALVQEHLRAADESVVRVEILGGCRASPTGVSGPGLPIEAFDPPPELIEDAKRIVAAAGMDLGGIFVDLVDLILARAGVRAVAA